MKKGIRDMKKDRKEHWRKLMRGTTMAGALLAVITLSGCAGMEERLSRVGVEPPFSKIQNPEHEKGYKPLTFPMPKEHVAEQSPNSLW